MATLAVAAFIAAGCGSAQGDAVAADLTATAHAASECADAFVPLDLPHVTSGPGNTASTFDGTGAGVGVADLDADGDLDLVLPNLSGDSNILENNGGLSFTPRSLQVGRFRGVATVDVDVDGWTDVVLTTGIGPPVVFTNPGSGELNGFVRTRLDGVDAATYSMAWADLGGDGDLDLVTGSYNAELTLLRNSPVLGSNTGVVLHERLDDGTFAVERLAESAQALALITPDLNADGRTDIMVGNDLATPDQIWLATDDGFERTEPFSTTSYSTMSLDAADIDNDGTPEIFSTDMKPATPDDRYREVEADLAAAPVVDDIQTPENVLLSRSGDGWDNMAPGFGVDATGWSWSGLFGDLDNDGALDLYVATGMRSDQLFDFLPDARLVEENRAFRGDADFAPVPEWGLDDPAGGRGVAFADLDDDGDLDVVVNNLDEPARMFENRLCGGVAMTVELRWAGSGNPAALGSTIEFIADDVTRSRAITSSRGYLSSDPSEAHVGLGSADSVDLRITWPDGRVTSFDDQPTAQHLVVTRTAEK